MAQKTCTKCELPKDLNDFHCNKRKLDGRMEQCKSCKNTYRKSVYDPKRELAYNENRRKKSSAYTQWYNKLTPEQKLQLATDRRERVDKSASDKRLFNQTKKKTYLKAKEEKLLLAAERKSAMETKKAETKKRQRQVANDKYKFQYHNDPIFKLKEVLKKRTQKIFKRNGWATPERCGNLLRTDFETVKRHIEDQFVDGMGWMNHGTGDGFWHIDHRIPLDSAKAEEEVYPLFHYKNLQPLWTADNIRKSNNLIINI